MAEYNLGNVTGPQGEKGETGETGNGIESVTYTQVYSSAGENKIQFNFTDGTSSDEFVVLNGSKGDDGTNATITIGSVTTGTDAKVENVGTETNAILNFTIPNITDISQFDEVTALKNSDYLLLQRDSTVFKVSLESLLSFIAEN